MWAFMRERERDRAECVGLYERERERETGQNVYAFMRERERQGRMCGSL